MVDRRNKIKMALLMGSVSDHHHLSASRVHVNARTRPNVAIRRSFFDSELFDRHVLHIILGFLDLAESVYARHQRALGLYRYGYSSKANMVSALELFSQNAASGHGPSQLRLAEMYLFGRGTAKMLPLAAEFYSLAASSATPQISPAGSGVPDIAEYFLSLIPANSLPGCTVGVASVSPKPLMDCVRSLENSAGQDDNPDRIECAYVLGLMFGYEDGCNNNLTLRRPVGLPAQNAVTAAEWWLKAAHGGYPPAQFELAKCYMHGRGTQLDRGRAVTWLQKAAEHGDYGPAQVELAIALAQGRGVPRQPALARQWFESARARGMEREVLQWQGLVSDADDLPSRYDDATAIASAPPAAMRSTSAEHHSQATSSSSSASAGTSGAVSSDAVANHHEFVHTGSQSRFFLAQPVVFQCDPSADDEGS